MNAVAARLAMRRRRRLMGMREIRLDVPDARSAVVRTRVAERILSLDAGAEEEAIRWVEAVSEFDNDEAR